jgi:hypothetical protein
MDRRSSTQVDTAICGVSPAWSASTAIDSHNRANSGRRTVPFVVVIDEDMTCASRGATKNHLLHITYFDSGEDKAEIQLSLSVIGCSTVMNL